MSHGASPISYTPKFAYVANDSSGISAFTVNPATGALSELSGSPFPAGKRAQSVAFDPASRFAYVANYYSSGEPNDIGNVSMYLINPSTGALTSNGAVTARVSPASVTVDPSGRFAYVVNASSGSVSMFSIDGSNGTLMSIAMAIPAGNGPNGVAVDPSGRFAYVANCGITKNVSMYTISVTTGALTPIGMPVPAGMYPCSVAVDPSGRFAYVANTLDGNISMYTINATTGALTSMGMPVAAGVTPVSVAVDPSGRFVYVSNYYGGSLNIGNISMYTINPTSGVLTPIGMPVDAGKKPSSVTVDPSGRFAYVTNEGSGNVSIFAINAITGALTSTGPPIAAGTAPLSVATTGTIQ